MEISYKKEMQFYDLEKLKLPKDNLGENMEDVNCCLQWLDDEQDVQESADFGSNEKAVSDALGEQRHRVTMVNAFKSELTKVTKEKPGSKKKLEENYDKLQSVSQKRLNCLLTVKEISKLESVFGAVSSELAKTATELVQKGVNRDDVVVENATKNCIEAVRANWSWISKMVACTDIHLKHASEYHQYFNQVAEHSSWMNKDLNLIKTKEAEQRNPSDKRESFEKLLLILKEILASFLFWQNKAYELLVRSKEILPVRQRVEELDHLKPIQILCEYKTKQVGFLEKETVTLMDNSHPQNWTIRKLNGMEAKVPSIICLIPGPDPLAVQAAFKMNLKLLCNWTMNVKHLGKTIIRFLLLLFKKYNKREKKLLESISSQQREKTQASVAYVMSVMDPYWMGFKGYDKLKTQLDVFQDIMQTARSNPDNPATELLVLQLDIVRRLLQVYQEFWQHWETYRILLETSNHTDLVLFCDDWENLQFMELSQLRKLWHKRLGWTEEDEKEFEDEEKEVEKPLEATEEVTTSEQEEKRTFVITGVVDPRSDEEISMQQAVMLGIINSQSGTYVNPVTGETYPIPIAMNAGLIKVEYTTTKTSVEKKRDIGIITVKSQGDNCSEIAATTYAINGVVDQKTKSKVTFNEAIKLGILIKETGSYIHNLTGEKIYVSDAIEKGFIKATVITDPSSMDIDTNNQIVVNRLDAIKDKIIKPMKVAAALKKAGAAQAQADEQNGSKGDKEDKKEKDNKQPDVKVDEAKAKPDSSKAKEKPKTNSKKAAKAEK